MATVIVDIRLKTNEMHFYKSNSYFFKNQSLSTIHNYRMAHGYITTFQKRNRSQCRGIILVFRLQRRPCLKSTEKISPKFCFRFAKSILLSDYLTPDTNNISEYHAHNWKRTGLAKMKFILIVTMLAPTRVSLEWQKINALSYGFMLHASYSPVLVP